MTDSAPDGYVTVEKHVLGDLTANVKRWQNQSANQRHKRQRWRRRAMAAEKKLKEMGAPLNDEEMAGSRRAVVLATIFQMSTPEVRAEVREMLDDDEIAILADALACKIEDIDWGDDG